MTAQEADELTVDELAARVGMTVRNLRAYAARGLLPPPRLVGRTGYYGPQHVDRLLLVREMLGQGHTLAAIEKTLADGPQTAGPASLALHRALLAPWLPEEPYETDGRALAAQAGQPQDPELLQRLEALGLVELLEGGRVRVLDPPLLAAGMQVVRLGVDPGTLVEAQIQVADLVMRAAETYVQMFHDTVWAGFVARGAPDAEWPAIQETVERLQPVAAQALLASFRTAMAAAVSAELGQVDTAPPLGEGQPHGG